MTNTPEWIVVHTAAHGTRTKNYDSTAAQIDKWHREANGWKMIGYHYVIRHSGDIEKGREENQSGAHALGLNKKSIGICFSGHGDYHTWTSGQLEKGIELISELADKYGIDTDHIIGHREVNVLVDKGILSNKCRVAKTCPGKKIDMDEVRDLVDLKRNNVDLSDEENLWGKALFDAMVTLYKFNAEVDGIGDFGEKLNEMRNIKKVNRIIEAYKESISGD